MGLVIYSNAGGDGDLLLAKPSLPCKSISAKEKDKAIHLTWEDPDSPEDTSLYSEWASTRIVRKEGGFPVDENDGVIVVTSTTKNEYKDTAYIDGGLTNGTTYYYRAFTCSIDNIYDKINEVQVSARPNPYKTMTVILDLNDSNPETCGSYTDDAIGMSNGKTDDAITAWQKFFGYRPCLFKDGKVVGYLNPNDYSKFEDGKSADITSGNAGDVMIEFPRRGVNISKSGKIITIKMTDDPDDPEFTYYAHTRGADRKDYFYLSAYSGYVMSGKLRSLSGKTVTRHESMETFRKYAQANGSGYEQLTWFQWIYIQSMYVLHFRGNLNSSKIIGCGMYSDGDHTSGTLNTKALIYGENIANKYIKVFGLEDIWGLNEFYLDGIVTGTDKNVFLATTDFNNDGSGYNSYPFDNLRNMYGLVSDVAGSSELGFYPTGYSGSYTTYFCDYASSGNSKICITGYTVESWQTANAGIFCITSKSVDFSESKYSMARLSYY